jgi:polyhydroxybutyrate depolymerase
MRPASIVGAVLVVCFAVSASAQRQRGAARGAAPGAESLKLTVAGQERDAAVFTPTAKTPGGHPPLVLVFHGHGGSSRAMAAQLPLHSAWPEAVVAYPQGLPTPSHVDPGGAKTGWDSNEDGPTKANNRDLAFVDALLTKLHTQYSTDDARTYAAGFSNGAAMTLMLWTTRGSKFAAYAADAGNMFDWKPTMPKPVLYIGGDRDPEVTPAMQRDTIALIRTADGATAEGQPCGTGCTLYSSASRSQVQVMRHSGAHQVPSFATDAMVAFFRTSSK